MAIAITCPSCDATYKLADNMRGKKVICRECKNSIVVTSGGTAKRDEGNKARKGQRVRDEEVLDAEEVEEVAEAEEVEEAAQAEEVEEADAEEIEAAEEADTEDLPRTRKRAGENRKKGLSPVVLVGGGVAVAAIVGVVIFVAMGGRRDAKGPTTSASGNQVASGVPMTPPMSPPGGPPSAPPSGPPSTPPSASPTASTANEASAAALKPPADTPAEGKAATQPTQAAKVPSASNPVQATAVVKEKDQSKSKPPLKATSSFRPAKVKPPKKNVLVVARMSEGKIYQQVVKSSVWVLGERSKFRLIIPDSFLRQPTKESGSSETPGAEQPEDPKDAPPGGPKFPRGKKGKKPETPDDDEEETPLQTIMVQPPLHYSGSGSLISRKHRLILTNVHVAGDADKLIFHFPDFDEKGDPIVAKEHYEKKTGIPGKLVARMDRADAALVQLESLPPDIPPLPIAEKSARQGQRVHSVGSPGASAVLFNYSPGSVRQVLKHKWLSPIPLPIELDHLMFCDSWVLHTDSTTNQGDSGGPLVDDWGRLVGICQGHNPSAIKLRQFIDVREIRALIERYYKKIGEKWVPETPEILPAELAVIPELEKKLEPGNPLVERVKAIHALERLEADAGDAFGSLFSLLSDPDAPVRRAAASALKRIPPDKDDVPLLCEYLKDKEADNDVRLEAVKFLTKLGPEAKPAADTVAEQLKDADPELRKELFVALLTIGPDGKHVSLLKDAWRDTDPEIRSLVGKSLIKLGPKAKAALPVLVGALKSPDPATRLIAARAMYAIGPEADAKANLLEAMKDNDRALSVTAANNLVKLGEAKQVLPVLIDILKNTNGDVRKQACRGLASLGPKVNDKAAVEELIVALDEISVRMDAAKALSKMGRFSADIVAAKMLKVLNKDSRKTCIMVLERIGHIDEKIYAALDRLQNVDPDEGNRKLAKKALKKLTGGKGVG